LDIFPVDRLKWLHTNKPLEDFTGTVDEDISGVMGLWGGGGLFILIFKQLE